MTIYWRIRKKRDGLMSILGCKYYKQQLHFSCFCGYKEKGVMVQCSFCSHWVHCLCISISKSQADELPIYMCPTCCDVSKITNEYSYLFVVDSYYTIVPILQNIHKHLVHKQYTPIISSPPTTTTTTTTTIDSNNIPSLISTTLTTPANVTIAPVFMKPEFSHMLSKAY